MRQEVRVHPEKMIKEAEDSVDDLDLVTDSPGLYPFGHLEVTHRQVQPARLHRVKLSTGELGESSARLSTEYSTE